MSGMVDFEIAFYLYKMAAIHAILLNEKYRAKAYFDAAMSLDSCGTYVQRMYETHTLGKARYIGKKIEKCISSLIETGRLEELEEKEAEWGIKDYTLLLSKGLNGALIKKLWDGGIHSADDLTNITDGLLDAKEMRKVEKFTSDSKKWGNKYLYGYAKPLGKEIIEFIKKSAHTEASFCGDMAGDCTKVSAIEIAAICKENGDEEWEKMLGALKTYKRVRDVRAVSSGGIRREIEGLLRSPPQCRTICGKTLFGIPFEIKRMVRYALNGYSPTIDHAPSLQTASAPAYNIRGDLHTHTEWSDGIHSIEQMIGEAETRGYEYIAITDHSKSEHVAGGLSERDAMSCLQEIRKINERSKVKGIAGIEVDILSDGSLDYSDEVLSQFDFVVAAIHSGFEMNAFQMEKRIEKALSNPYVDVFAHPTGRLLGRPGVLFSGRDAYCSAARIIEICKENGVAMEVNCFPERMDIDGDTARAAAARGVMLSMGTDSHSASHLCNMEYGEDMLRHSAIDGGMILNTLGYGELMSFLEERRQSRLERRRPASSLLGRIEEAQWLDTPQAVYRGATHLPKDFAYYFGGDEGIMSGRRRVIGIDLTGSEKKESGWALMSGRRAECRRIKTDGELIKSVEEAKPDVVSIDSPLAKPAAGHGIMRECERMLSKFGISAYPSMIDSMVSLTNRGCRLASLLREKGYDVIESYPGAAQDVMSIPRKGKTVTQFEHLKRGIAAFGITGDILDKNGISHDEVDAITSALVGYFYLAGKSFGLGNEEEGFLVVPQVWESAQGRKAVIGLAGETAAGKTTTALYLQFKYGFVSFRYSRVLSEMYGTEDKAELQRIGAEVSMSSDKQRMLTRKMVEKMNDGYDAGKSFVIDGLRHWEDYEELQKRFGDNFVLVYIGCRYNERCKRYISDHEGVTKEDFAIINNHKAEGDIPVLEMHAEEKNIISNNKGFVDLWKQIDNIILRTLGERR